MTIYLDTDREKFNAWVKACPVTVSGLEQFADGYVEVHVEINDERNDIYGPAEDVRDCV